MTICGFQPKVIPTSAVGSPAERFVTIRPKPTHRLDPAIPGFARLRRVFCEFESSSLERCTLFLNFVVSRGVPVNRNCNPWQSLKGAKVLGGTVNCFRAQNDHVPTTGAQCYLTRLSFLRIRTELDD